jgi:hypothetical protein
LPEIITMNFRKKSGSIPFSRILLYGLITGCAAGLVSISLTTSQRVLLGLFCLIGISAFGATLKWAQVTKNQWVRKNAITLYVVVAVIIIISKVISILLK